MALVSYLTPSPMAPKSVTDSEIGIGFGRTEVAGCDWIQMTIKWKRRDNGLAISAAVVSGDHYSGLCLH